MGEGQGTELQVKSTGKRFLTKSRKDIHGTMKSN